MFQIQPSLDADRPFFGRVEGLRGLGAMAVAGYHLTGATIHGVPLLPDDGWSDVSMAQNAFGYLGRVVLSGHAFLMAFFVISGFVLRLSLGHGPQGLRAMTTRFGVARLFRFYPIVMVAVVVAAALGVESVSTRQIVGNLLLFDVSLNRHLWALQVELLMMPVILLLFLIERRAGQGALAIVAVATSILSFAPFWAGWAPLSNNMFAFVLGMLVPTWGRRLVSEMTFRRVNIALAACALVMFATASLFGTYSRYAALCEGYAAFIAMSIVAYRPDVAALRVLDWRWLKRLGTAAGSYYVMHMATASAAVALAAAVIPPTVCVQFPAFVSAAVIGVWLLAMAPLMMLLSKAVEEPGIALGRRVIRYLAPRETPVIRSLPQPVFTPQRRAA